MAVRAGAAFALAAVLVLAAPAAAAGSGQSEAVSTTSGAEGLPGTVPGVLLVTTSGAAASAGVRAAAATGDARAIGSHVVQVTVEPARALEAAVALAGQPGVVAVEPARYRRALAVPRDPLYPRQWAHQLAGAETGWAFGTGSPDVLVAVIDNGVDGRHPDLRRNVREQRVFADGGSETLAPGSDNRRCDGDDHGTHVAGVIGARGDDGVGVAGVAWQVGLLDYAVFRSFDGDCGASDVDVLAAMRAATAAGADVINLSLGGFAPEYTCSTAYQAVIDQARAAGTVVVAASGNAEEDPSSAGRPTVPASCNGVLSVGAVTRGGEHAAYSTTNEHVDLVAPGGDRQTGFADGVLSTVGDAGHDWLDGTSMAAAYVSGSAALLRAVAPELTADQVEGLLETTARDVGPDGRDPAHGWGLVDVGAALERASAGARTEPQPDVAFPVGKGPGRPLQLPPAPSPAVYRVSAGGGTTAAVTQAVAVSQSAFADGTAAHAVLARPDGFADALTGSSLTLGVAPLLFARSAGALPPETREELLRVLPQGSVVYLLGGTAALPKELEEELRALGFEPVRVAGRTRAETAVAVAHQLAYRRAELGRPEPATALLASGDDWPDAVAAGSLASHYGIPILLTPQASLHPASARLLRELAPDRLHVLGGSAAISDKTAAAAASAAGATTTRVAGPDRYATSIAIAEQFQRMLGDDGVQPRCVVAVNVVRDDGFAHALSASSLGGVYGCVMVPVDGAAGERLPVITRGYVDLLAVDGVVAGDVDVISDAAAQDLQQLLQR